MITRLVVCVLVGALSLLAFFSISHAPVTQELPSATRAQAPAWERRIDFHTHVHPMAYELATGLFARYGTSLAVNLSSNPDPELVAALVAHAAKTKAPFVTFAGIDWSLLDDPETFGERAADRFAACVNAGARGMKISKGLGLALRWPDGSLVAVDDERLDPVFERAGLLGVPVAIHVGDPVAFWSPVDENNERYDELALHPEWSLFGREVPSHRELMAAASRRYARHPNTQFVGVHVAGFPEDLDEVDALLEAHPNLSVDIAARVPEIGHAAPDRGRAFFEKHQDRILFGTDLGLGRGSIMLGAPLATRETAADVERFFSSTRRYLETHDRSFVHPTAIQGDWLIDGVGLSPAVLEKIYLSNARAMLTPRVGPSSGP